MTLTDAKIRNLKPRDKPYKVSDFEGLFLLVKPTGSRLWHQKYRIDGKEKLLAIGSYPEVGLAQARLARDAARALLASGKDPSQVKQDRKREEKERRGLAFESQAAAYFDKTKKEGRAETTLVKTKWPLDMAVDDFGAKPMSEIRAHARTALAAVGEDGVRLYTAPPMIPDRSGLARLQARIWADDDPTRGQA